MPEAPTPTRRRLSCASQRRGWGLTKSFYCRFLDLANKRSPLCVGIDPSSSVLRSWGLRDDVNGLRTFCDIVIEATADKVSVMKPQAAFFERFGSEGFREMIRAIARIKETGTLALLDAKRADISTSALAYGQAFLGDDSPARCDAITANAYLGLAALDPILSRAKDTGSCVFVVVRSSNPEGTTLQLAKTSSGQTIAEMLCTQITETIRQAGTEEGHVGAVIGATLDEDQSHYAGLLPHSIMLAPGIGAQGATMEDVAKGFGDSSFRVIPSVSREIYSPGPSKDAVAKRVDAFAEDARSLVRKM